jgi:hypothetical protein
MRQRQNKNIFILDPIYNRVWKCVKFARPQVTFHYSELCGGLQDTSDDTLDFHAEKSAEPGAPRLIEPGSVPIL